MSGGGSEATPTPGDDIYCTCAPEDFSHGQCERLMLNHPRFALCGKRVSPEECERLGGVHVKLHERETASLPPGPNTVELVGGGGGDPRGDATGGRR